MTAVRAMLEDAVVTLLQDLVAPLGIRTIRAYAGEMGTGTAEDMMRALNGLAPGILVSTDRGTYKGISVHRDSYHRDIELVLYLISSVQSTREDRLRGDNQIYEMADAILSRLIGIKPDLGSDVSCGHLEPVGEEEIVHSPQIAVWRQNWLITVEAELAEQPSADVTETLGRIGSEDEATPTAPACGVSNLIS
jgi:hypothetical protein